MIELEVIEDLINIVNNNKKTGCRINLGIGNPSVVILGEKHGDPIERQHQENLIEKLRPEYVLVEDITNDDFTMWEEKYGCKAELCDLSHQEKETTKHNLGFRDFGFIDSVSTEDELLKSQFYNARENKMGEIIINYSKESSKPIIVIIGHYHASEKSKIHEFLEQGKIDYICIWNETAIGSTYG